MLQYRFHAGKDYMTAGEHDNEMQNDYLMALDFMDSIGPDMRLLNICPALSNSQPWHAQLGKPNCCPLANVNNMWLQPDPKKRHWTCQAVWDH